MHPKPDDWIEYASGRVRGRQREALARHLTDGCEACRKAMERYRRLFETIAADRLLEPPSAALSAAVHSFRPAENDALPAWARAAGERLARVVFDTLGEGTPSFAGARSSTTARRIRFEAGDVELDVLVEPEGDRRRLTAQVLSLRATPAPVSGARFLIVAGGATEAEGETDDHGEMTREIQNDGEIEIRVATDRRIAIFRITDPLSSSLDD